MLACSSEGFTCACHTSHRHNFYHWPLLTLTTYTVDSVDIQGIVIIDRLRSYLGIKTLSKRGITQSNKNLNHEKKLTNWSHCRTLPSHVIQKHAAAMFTCVLVVKSAIKLFPLSTPPAQESSHLPEVSVDNFLSRAIFAEREFRWLKTVSKSVIICVVKV